jgi:hypothetical protein
MSCKTSQLCNWLTDQPTFWYYNWELTVVLPASAIDDRTSEKQVSVEYCNKRWGVKLFVFWFAWLCDNNCDEVQKKLHWQELLLFISCLAYFADLHSEVFEIENDFRSEIWGSHSAVENCIPLWYNLLQFLHLLTQQCGIMTHKTQVLDCRSVYIVAFVLWHHIALQVDNDQPPIFMVEARKVNMCSDYVLGTVTLLDHSEHGRATVFSTF